MFAALERAQLGGVRGRRRRDQRVGEIHAPGAIEELADFDALVGKLSAAIAKDRIPGAGIAVVCNGERIFAAGAGKTKKGGADAVTGKTRFQIASITKTFTSTAIIRLEGELIAAAWDEVDLLGLTTQLKSD